MKVKAQTKRELKIGGISLAIGILFGIYLAHPTKPKPKVTQATAALTEATDAWLDDLDRELADR